MLKSLKGFGIAAAVVAGLLGIHILVSLWSMGQFARLKPHFDGKCSRLEGIVGAEDIELDHASGRIFVSSFDRRAHRAGQEATGAIYHLSFDNAEAVGTDLGAQTPADFRPHGLSLYRDDEGKARLFVVSHPTDGQSVVEIFDIEDQALSYVATVPPRAAGGKDRHKELVSVNDIAAVGPGQFYFTNDSGYKSGAMRFFEYLFRTPTSTVMYYNGTRIKKVATGLRAANGIAVDRTGNLVYVTESLGQTLQIYKRNKDLGTLSRIATIDLDSTPDNIHVDVDGNVWIGAHPKIVDLLMHNRDAANNSPSQVLKVAFGVNAEAGIEEVYLGRGAALSGSSVAVPVGNRLLIGSINEPHILICARNSAT